MSFSRITVEQRSKEAKALKLILAYSLIGSLALHVAVLASGIGNFSREVSSSKEEPIEVMIIDSPKPPLEKKQQTKKEVALRTQPVAEVSPQAISSKAIAQKENDGTATTLLHIHKFSDRLNTSSVQQQPSQTTEITQNSQLTPQTRPVAIKSPVQQKEGTPVKPVQSSRTEPTSESNLSANSLQQEPIRRQQERSSPKSANLQRALAHPNAASKTQPDSAGGQGSGKLTQVPPGVRDSRSDEVRAGNIADPGNLGSTVSHSTVAVGDGTFFGTGDGTGSDTRTKVGTGNGTGSSTDNRSGSGTGNRAGNGETITTGSSPARMETSSGFGHGRGNSSGEDNGRAACSECAAKYPESARRRGIEGRVEVAVDTDEKGHVTNVRITHSSGHPELDEDTLRQARDWKLKPTNSGRQGVTLAADYALEGSRRHRERSERKKQKEAERRNQNTTADNSNSTESDPSHRRQLTSGTIADVPPEPITKGRQESASSYSRPATIQAEAALSRSLRRESGASDQPRESSSTEASHQQRLREAQRHSQHQDMSTDSPRSKEAPTTRRRRTEEAASNSESRLSASQRRRGSEEGTPSSQDLLRDSLRRSRQESQSPNTLKKNGEWGVGSGE